MGGCACGAVRAAPCVHNTLCVCAEFGIRTERGKSVRRKGWGGEEPHDETCFYFVVTPVVVVVVVVYLSRQAA